MIDKKSFLIDVAMIIGVFFGTLVGSWHYFLFFSICIFGIDIYKILKDRQDGIKKTNQRP